ncbi:probable plastid-lipid-associated protein 13, chloroplastic [Humulus lupulus]|uniref:probable plastid-lipid-associated protein 13, chloroplastic n=1 Tax=Humulus lupulus TaxID=3486 RepID=UPI002B4034F4|nr:probable plastid-lipid-associated protein 13, chloroplastic [Humulus lupulus]
MSLKEKDVKKLVTLDLLQMVSLVPCEQDLVVESTTGENDTPGRSTEGTEQMTDRHSPGPSPLSRRPGDLVIREPDPQRRSTIPAQPGKGKAIQSLVTIGHAQLRAVDYKELIKLETKFTPSTKLSVEGPLRMREEYAEGVFETPKVIEKMVPKQLKGALGQVANTIQQLPVPVRDAFTGGLRVPLSGTFQRLFMISYLDDEILITRDTSGVLEVLTRLDAPSLPLADTMTEYES